MRIATLFILSTLAALLPATWSSAQVGVNGSRIEENFNYPAGPLDGQSGGGEVNLEGPSPGGATWTSTGYDTMPGDGDPFVVREENLVFGPQVTLFENVALGSLGRNPQVGVGGASRLIGNGNNTNIEANLTNNFKENFTHMKLVWNGGKAGFALANEDFNLSNFNIRLQSDPSGLRTGWGFTIEADGGNPDLGILRPTAFEAYANDTSSNTTGNGIELNKGEVYHVFFRAELSSQDLFGGGTEQDQFSVYVLSESDVANPESTVYLADLPSTQQSTLAKSVFNFNVKNGMRVATYATQNFQIDDLTIGWLNGTDSSNFVDCATCDTARQALVAFRTENERIAWKSSLGDPYLPGDTNLNGVVLGSATNSNPNSNDINVLALQARLGNTSTVSYLDLDSSGVIDYDDVVYLVEAIYGSSMGDFDLDFDVDEDDLAAWEVNYGGGGGWTQGDANGNGLIDGGDFLIWQRNYTGPGGLVGAASAAVPEPTTGVLVVLSCVGSMVLTRRSTAQRS